MGRLEGKVAVITGGASGLGEASARLFFQEGARVVVADIDDERGKKLAASFGQSGAFIHTNVVQEEQVKAAVTAAVDRFGRLDVMFNNAGMAGAGGQIQDITVEGWDMTFAVHVRGVLLGMKHAAPVMKGQGSGSIINTASMAGLRAGWGPHAYSAAKAAIVHLTRTVAMELGESNIRVNCLCPTWISTPLFGKAVGFSAEKIEEVLGPLKTAFENLHPIPRACLPSDVAYAALFLASDESGFINGQALAIDGGAGAGRKWMEFVTDTLAPALGLTLPAPQG
jgi:NAD(P)-dependent dehydrogenase (short-subunit alcohol dehydrogenase family)